MNLLGIDFEEWYHPELIQPHIKSEDKKFQVVNGIDKIIEWLRKNDTFATFFAVGEIIESKPEILDKIIGNGHEIAFHTMHHTNLNTHGFKENFQTELSTFEKLTGGKSCGFRAPTFSLNENSSWVIDMLIKNGYKYDSSVVPAKTSMYGIPNAKLFPYKISSTALDKEDPNSRLTEFPLLATSFFGKRVLAGGGFFLRTLPFRTIINAIKHYEKFGFPATFYIHSWELTPEWMPKLSLPFKSKFITYHNINSAFSRMDLILKKFEFTSFARYIS